jgi:hypothetical protein
MMMLREVLRSSRLLLGAVLVFWLGTSCAPADTVSIAPDAGAQGLVDVGNVVAALTNDINDASSFTLGALVSTAESHGFFVGMPMQFFGPVTFSVADPGSLQFGSTEFGSFASTKISQLSNDPLVGSRSLLVEGMFTRGTFGGPLFPMPLVTNFTLSLNQNAGAGTSISVNATLDFADIQPVPEPSALALATVALGTTGLVWLRRGRAPAGVRRAATSGPRRRG